DRRTCTPFPTAAALELERASWRDLETALLRGAPPDAEQLVGGEFRGMNRFPLNGSVPIGEATGIKEVRKGFFRGEDRRARGYTSKVKPNALDGRWTVGDKRFGFYEVNPVDPTSRDNRYLHALLLDYSKGGNKASDPSNGLRDYLV